ncbi:shikimate dehydrogenase [Buchnera aphidicola]|uniref:Shikimate dehydrogenase (NADP(+)) n=1 Tax=Buchnera aphidicola subsp. Schizaphis graminum (strain Sg) TaxID=198804 RepID=AROE_BUCAP|nr:shikimate dehydrogenase [Buchnera aphidicola]P46240.2 RecName: Full=Shikimate dehydrogenase (NADP(+)); Short=SDH [Buchnera aphidicola str. Sg (Schizaphis graminum)]AAM68017.1 shikimate 5-dehydrogenase [Buchnera aphidicola str. Sg (Schizaphis graminum)]AWI49493.1 shikimate dehydrogenase [Buchnera aphidicola (Schizaphis graminum)]
MCKLEKFNYALFGNPIDHSQSPKIHNFFATQTGILHIYKAINIPLDQFSSVVSDFFKKNIKGANVTAPFKKEAYFFSDKLTERAKIAQSVNTLKKISDKCILGDNTDGIGLLSDLVRLNFIKKNFSILILGAGGAVKGVLLPLLSLGCSVYILNRTILNAKILVKQFNKYGKIFVFDRQNFKQQNFDLVINAMSRNTEKKNFLPLSLITSKTFFYDMNYSTRNTPFINWCSKAGGSFISNGIGMLVFQAAYSFLEWHNVLPEINYIINILNIK